jgi:pimeloyl-ACP methyl ester carboxylesterase
VIICAHGYSGNGRDFDFLARKLSSDARVVCPDMAGRGRSAWLQNSLGYNFPQFLSDIRALVAELGVPGVEWVGTSMGGLLGLLLAAEPRSPIVRLVLNDVGAFVPADALAAIGRNLRAPERFESMAALEAHVRHTHREWGPMTDEHWSHVARHAARRLADGYALHYDPRIASFMQPTPFAPGLSLWSAWYRVRCPALLIRGATSSIFPAEVARAMVQVKPGTECVEIPDAGHAPSLMAAKQTAIVGQFLERGLSGLKRAA